MELPHCSSCLKPIDSNVVQVQECSHIFCSDCFSGICPIDQSKMTTDAGTEQIRTLLDSFIKSRSQSDLSSLYDLINVNSVQCRLLRDPKHVKEACRYDHTFVDQEDQDEQWKCPKCGVNVDKDSLLCPMCLTSRPKQPEKQTKEQIKKEEIQPKKLPGNGSFSWLKILGAAVFVVVAAFIIAPIVAKKVPK